MTIDETSGKKSAVQKLNFGAKTARRVTWESWEFTVVGPHQVRVTNASYGYLKDNHAYVVGVEERDGVAVPAECECKADQYNEEYDCKHKVALATVGGPIVLNAALEYESQIVADPAPATTVADKLRTDGGPHEPGETSDHESDCDCLENDFPCFDCYQTGRRNLPE